MHSFLKENNREEADIICPKLEKYLKVNCLTDPVIPLQIHKVYEVWEMAGNEWPPLVEQEGKELTKIVTDFLPSDANSSTNKQKRVIYHASSLNSAYCQMCQQGLVPVTKTFQALYEGPKMEIFLHELVDWDLVKVAVQKPAKRFMREGKNSQAKSLTGPEKATSLIPSDNFSCPGSKGAAVVNCCKRRRKQKMTAAKTVQFSDRRLFRAECKKKRKRGRRKSKGEKAKRDSAARKQDGDKRVGSKKYQKKVVARDSTEQKEEASKDSDLETKVYDQCHR